MRLYEFLTESTEDDTVIDKIITSLPRHWSDIIRSKPVTLGKLTRLHSDDPIYSRLLSVRIKVGTVSSHHIAHWDNANNEIVFSMNDAVPLVRTLRHELRHAVDDFKSNGKSYPAQTDLPWGDRPTERSAEYSAVLGELKRLITYHVSHDSSISSDDLRDYIDKSISKMYTSKLAANSPEYKRLFKRMYVYANSVIDKHETMSLSKSDDPPMQVTYRINGDKIDWKDHYGIKTIRQLEELAKTDSDAKTMLACVLNKNKPITIIGDSSRGTSVKLANGEEVTIYPNWITAK